MSEPGEPRPIAMLPAPRKRVQMLRFAPGRDDVLAMVHAERLVAVWDLARADVPMYNIDAGRTIAGLRFWPDERGLLVWTDRGASALDLDQETQIARLPPPSAKLTAASAVVQGIQALGTVLSLIPVAGGGVWAILPAIAGASSGSAASFNFASVEICPRAERLAGSSHAHRISVRSLVTGEMVREWKHAVTARSHVMWLDEHRLVATSAHQILILDVREKKPLVRRTAHLSGVRALVRMPGGLIATIGENQNMRLWTREGEKEGRLVKLRKQTEEAWPLDEHRLLARATNRRLYLIDLREKPAMRAISTGTAKLSAIAASDDGSHAALVGSDRVVRMYETRELLAQLAGA